MSKAKAIKVIREIRQMEDDAYKQWVFCKQHGFGLEAQKFKAIEDELRRVCRMIESEFETGYVSLTQNQ